MNWTTINQEAFANQNGASYANNNGSIFKDIDRDQVPVTLGQEPNSVVYNIWQPLNHPPEL
jgi:hypothetical protein